MASILVALIYLTGLYPLLRAWQANRHTTLFQTVHWTAAAWAAWGMTIGAEPLGWSLEAARLARYLALCLTACAGVAVLGARRPGVGPWNFVLLGLLAVMLLPLAEGLIARGAMHLEGPRTVFLAGTLAVIVLNYLPTRLGLAALLLGLGGGGQILLLRDAPEVPALLQKWEPIGNLLLAFVPWAGLERLVRRPPPASEFDRIWLGFRDRFGLVWGQRLREQFNNAASHAGWLVVLRWQGLRILPGAELPEATEQAAMIDALRALTKRFRTDVVETESP